MRSSRTNFTRLCAGAAPLAIVLGLTTTPAMAQTAAALAPAAQAPADDAAAPDVVVTGTLFRTARSEEHTSELQSQ